jgi:Bacterial Ig domain
MQNTYRFASLRSVWAAAALTVTFTVSGLITGCGGGSGQSTASGPSVVSTLTLSGTAATGRAIAAAAVSAKCRAGSGSTSTADDGRFQIQVPGGSLPCLLQVTDPGDGSTLHGATSGADSTGSGSTVNVTPLTEMLAARALGQLPAAFFAAFDPGFATQNLASARLKSAQTDIAAVLADTIDTTRLPADFAASPLKAATALDASAGDSHDQLLDALRSKLNARQVASLANALAGTASTAAVKQVASDGVASTAAQLTSMVSLSSNMVQLSWADTYPSGSRYRVEAQKPDGSFTAVETLSGLGGTGSMMQWQRAITVAMVYRVQAVLPDRTVVISTPQGQGSVVVAGPEGAPQIVLDQTEPVSGSVRLSLAGNTAWQGVTWYADLRRLGTGSGVGAPLTWTTNSETNGTHLVLARVQMAPDSYTEVRRSVQVSNSNLAINASVSGSTGTVLVDVRASSQFGIARVEARFNGLAADSLTAPNACSRYCAGTNDVYRFTVNASQVGSGEYTMLLTAIDGSGGSKTINLPISISNLPVLTLNSPVDGAFVTGTLQLSGNASSDRSGALRVTASLGDVEFLNTTNTNFSGSFNLSGLTPGSYTLTVRATDAANKSTVLQRTVTVSSAPALSYTPLFSLGTNGQLIKVDESNPALLLYKADDGSYRVRNTTAGTEVTLQGAHGIPHLYNWAMDGGYVYVEGGFLGSTGTGYTDCPLVCIYQWSPSGNKTNLSTLNPNAISNKVGGGRAYEQYPRAHGGNVIWIDAAGSNPGTFTRYLVASGTYSTITQPSGSNYLINTEYDFFVDANGNVVFFFGAQSGGEGATSTFDVYRWSSLSNTSIKVSSGGARSIYPKTDGQTVAWLQSATGSAAGGSATLLSQSVSGGGIQVVSNNASEGFFLRDGILAWRETVTSASTGKFGGTVTTVTGIKAATLGSTSTVSSLSSAVLYGAGAGHLLFGESGKTYSWNASTRSSVLRIDAAPTQVIVSGPTAYFVMGATQTVYRLALP